MTSLYLQSVPVMTKYLRNLSALLNKGKAFADQKEMKHTEMLEFRLIADMRGLPYQVQSCCNTAKFLVERVGGQPLAKIEDNETTFDELQERLSQTIKMLEGADPKGFEGKEDQEVIMETTYGNYRFTGQRYVSEFAIPYFHFHLTSAYCILRHLGVPIGAFDYLKDVMEKV
ncbi:hypothetical protein CONLIGDRAFT_664503 [Coniochaeta ligniaria NRRL 30616]|uniref:Uncharacterized protein n=1 Tax=Coniochaeta ligniaria NRRL 30616 TaxID=1408157 RepID=A0A1J7I7P7_9PEZI|nr:hypothetical protein CONLIGDRAFT_664503 [Coniochaeta ligniaria NRRL 30616]